MNAKIIINQINKEAEENKLYWVAGTARESWQVLQHHLNELHEVAQIAVKHYMNS